MLRETDNGTERVKQTKFLCMQNFGIETPSAERVSIPKFCSGWAVYTVAYALPQRGSQHQYHSLLLQPVALFHDPITPQAAEQLPLPEARGNLQTLDGCIWKKWKQNIRTQKFKVPRCCLLHLLVYQKLLPRIFSHCNYLVL